MTTTEGTLAARRRGAVNRSGIRIGYEVAGVAEPTVAFLPAWGIANRRMWAAQVAALAPQHRTIAYDGRGTGGSDRPTDPAAYDVAELVADAVAVLEATASGRAVVVGNSLGGLVGFLLAVQRPDLVAGLVLIGGSVDFDGATPSALQRAALAFDDVVTTGGADGWWRYNRHEWAGDFRGFVRWFVDTALGAEATDEARADGLAAGLDVGAEVLAASVAARSRRHPAAQAELLRGLAGRVACPVLVVTGDQDAVVPPAWGAEQARVLGARHVVLRGAGHCPHVTRPTQTADVLSAFLAEVAS
jgi:pimeloyl-ACP methyl ester carboxylesterase